MSNQHFKQLKYDTQESTFRHNIYYSCGRIVSGYTKKEGVPETPNDKRALLCGLLQRLNKSNYFDSPKQVKGLSGKFVKLDFFKNIRSKGWIHMVTIYPDYYEVNPDVIDPNIGNMIAQFDLFRKGEINDTFFDRYHNTAEAVPHNLNESKRFPTRSTLQSHCKRLLSQDLEEIGLVQHYYRSYCLQHFEEFKEVDQQFHDFLPFFKNSSQN
ncbi:hypothetical protein SAMN05661096_03611 [Marivirga sericea]|uniref:Uncharacterized protein n=1 Tax=Marivirga sericea TaxID=1028 RepID=A0A1X7L846_9BACT|nr:hypothetical protein [Marivirga sericea]SMG49432.1 hypothetical protein SAMN05661096_03611 [Marivirga sericea]